MIPLKGYCCQCSKVWRISQSLMSNFYIWRPPRFTGVILVYQKNFVGIELFSPAKNFSFCWNFAWEVARAFWVIHTRNMALMSWWLLFLGNSCFLFLYKTDQDHFQWEAPPSCLISFIIIIIITIIIIIKRWHLEG